MQCIKEIIDLKPRYKIFQLIKKYPGLHQKAIIKKSNYSEGTVRYHLDYFEKKELVSVSLTDKYKRYYVKDLISQKEKELLNVLRKKIPQNITLYIMIYMAGSRVKISRSLEIHPKLVEYHLKNLVEAGVLKQIDTEKGIIKIQTKFETISKEFKISNNEVLYTLKDFYEIYNFFIKYSSNFIDKKLINDCLDWIDFLSDTVFPNKRKSTKSQIDKIENVLYNVFPHPYYS